MGYFASAQRLVSSKVGSNVTYTALDTVRTVCRERQDGVFASVKSVDEEIAFLDRRGNPKIIVPAGEDVARADTLDHEEDRLTTFAEVHIGDRMGGP